MHRIVNAIAGRLSLRPPQRHSLEILDRITELASLRKGADRDAALAALKGEWPTLTDFERDFPSVCFALATGVGKTRLMGAFVSYLYLAHGARNFFVLAPNLTIYSKLIADFTPNTPKYVFRGIAEFATEPPQVITGDNYDATLLDQLAPCRVNIFNISKINSEVRGGRAPRIKRLSEYIGESYFEYLANLDDLVLLMDESHRYRASAGVRAINELKPVLGLELTATPFTESPRGPVPFKNVVYHYPLARAMDDGFVKEPAVVTRKDFNPAGIPPEEIERIKLEDGIRLHESVKVELATYARESGLQLVKPFVLVIARDTAHASQLQARIASDAFFEGRYKDRVLQVDSSRTGAEEDAMVEKLLRVEHADESTEIVIHVNMLKEGWDVTNLYTIVPLRAANARTLVEQSIGRGLRLPYGERTGITAVDRLNIVAHDRFQEIVDDANKPDSPLRLQAVEIAAEDLERKVVTVVSNSILSERLGTVDMPPSGTPTAAAAPLFQLPEERRVAQAAMHAIESLSAQPTLLPGASFLRTPEVQAQVVREVKAHYGGQLTLEGVQEPVDVERIVATLCGEVADATIDIPRVLVVPIGRVESGFSAFTLDLSSVRYPPVSADLWIQHLRTHDREILTLGEGGAKERRLEDYVVRGLVDFDDVSYDEQADLLYDLAGQTVRHFLTYLSEDETRQVLQFNQHTLVAFIHAQMQEHYWEKVAGYEVTVSHGFTALRASAYTAGASDAVQDYRTEPRDKTKIGQLLFGGFARCLYRHQKFGSDTERRFALILEREARRWFKPAKNQFQIFYRVGSGLQQYVPDFVAETEHELLMVETKARNEMTTVEVEAKRKAAEEWCRHASAHAATYGGKPWRYALVPHDTVADNMTLERLTGDRKL
ncbi:MAG: DEAD/DEAH box helicase family protein [Vicinamibacterales bacterium]